MIVRISAKAEADLESIADDIARDGPARALSFVRELRAKCLDLTTTCRAFPVVSRYRKLGVRRRVHGDYLIFLREEADAVAILHVLHGATDYATVLSLD